MIDPDYILLFTASETALRRKIYNHELYSRKNVIQPHIGGAILYLKIHIGHKGFLPLELLLWVHYYFVSGGHEGCTGASGLSNQRGGNYREIFS